MKEKRKNLFKLFEPFLISIFWILLFISPLFIGDNEMSWIHVLKVWKSLLPYLLLFLINRFVFLPLLFFKNQRILFILANLTLITVMAFGVFYSQNTNERPGNRSIANERLMPDRGPGQMPPLGPRVRRDMPKPPPNPMPPYISFMIISILIVGFDTGLKLSVKWVQSEQKRVSAEKENVESQLAFLRNQVSPHFFMNTLNNIHALIDFDAAEAKESIIRLSKLMRHLLYDSEVSLIPIQKEYEFISNYVDLMKLRYSDKVQINLQLPSELQDKKIPPLLFTSFVENAFKYGISYEQSSFINISFANDAQHLFFEISNSIPKNQKEQEVGGIGIENSRKRLNLLYANNYDLNIKHSEDVFTVSLKIPV